MNKRKILSIALSVAVLIFIMTISAFATAVTTEDNAVASIGSENYETIADTINAAKVGDTYYTTFAATLDAASKMTGDVVVEIYDKVTLNSALFGSYTSIKFVGMTENAEIYLEVQGYITATGKAVAFEDLTLSKSNGEYVANAGFMNMAFGIYDVNSVSYTDCVFTNGSYASFGVVTYTECTFYRSHDKYGLWAYGNTDVTVDNCVFADYRGIKMYAEGTANTTELTVKNTDFSALTGKPAIVLTCGESVTLAGGNTYSSTGTFELDLDGAPNGTAIEVAEGETVTCKNDNGACGIIVDGKIYTTVAQAAEVAEAGSKVTLLHNTTETVEFAEGVELNTNGYTAENVTIAVSAIAQIGDVEYSTIEEALRAVKNDETIVLLADCSITEVVELRNIAITIEGDYTITLNDKLKVFGESTLNIKSAVSGEVWLDDGVILKDSYINGDVFVAGNVTFRGENSINMLYDFGVLESNYGTSAPMAWTIEKGASLEIRSKSRYGLGYGDNVTIFGSIEDALTARESLTEGDVAFFAHGLVAQESKGWNKNNFFTVNDAYVVIGSNSSFGNKPGNYGGNYSFAFKNTVLDASRITFYEAVSKTELSFTNCDVVTGTFMTRDADSAFVLTNTKLLSTTTSNGNDEGNYNEGAITLVNSILTYSAQLTNNGTIKLDANSCLTAPSIIGTGKFIIDATSFTANKLVIDADLSGFTGTIEVVGNDKVTCELTGEGALVKLNPVAKIGDTEYATFAEALEVAQAGNTITLLADIESSTIIVINKAITLDGNGHKLTSTAGRAINVSGANGVTIKNLTIEASGERAINIIQNATNVTIDNVTATASNYTINIAGSTSDAVVTINKSVLNGLCTVNVAGKGANITITDSTINCNDNNETAGESYAALNLNKDAINGKITATGCTINVAEGSDSVKAKSSVGNGVITINGSTDGIVKHVAIIDYPEYNAYYGFATLQDAIDFAQAGNVITLIDDVILEATLTIPAGKAITLDLNGKTISQSKECTESYEMICNKGALTITGNGKISFTDTGVGSSSASWGAYTIRNTGTLVIENGTIENLSAQNVAGKPFAHTTLAIFQYSGSCTINGGTISCPSYRSVRLWKGEMVINGGAFVGQVWVQCVDETASLTINDGEFTNTWNDGSSVFVGNVDSNGKLHNTEFAITGGTFNGKVGCNNAEAVSGAITGGTFSSKAMLGTNSALLASGVEFVENEDGTYSVENRKVELSDIFTFKGYSVKENGTAIVASFNVNKELLEIYNTQNNATVVFGSYFTAYEMSNPAIKTELSNSYRITGTYDLIITEADGELAKVPFIMAMYIEVGNETSYLSANGIGDAKTVQTISLAEALNYPVATKEEK